VDLLRSIDSGELAPDALVVAYRDTANGKKTRFSMAAPDSTVGLGLLARAAWLINQS
jgi:hypothetical protein